MALLLSDYRARQQRQAGRWGSAVSVLAADPHRIQVRRKHGFVAKIGTEEQRTIFDQVGRLSLDAEDKAFVFDTLGNPPTLQDIASLARGPEQATEIYLASRLVIDPDHPAEVAYLEALASRLSLPSDLVAHLESQAAQVA